MARRLDATGLLDHQPGRRAAERRPTARSATRSGRAGCVAYRFMGAYRIRPEDLDAYIESCRVEQVARRSRAPRPQVEGGGRAVQAPRRRSFARRMAAARCGSLTRPDGRNVSVIRVVAWPINSDRVLRSTPLRIDRVPKPCRSPYSFASSGMPALARGRWILLDQVAAVPRRAQVGQEDVLAALAAAPDACSGA